MKAETALLGALLEIARYYRHRFDRRYLPLGFKKPKSNNAAPWTRAELAFLLARLKMADHRAERERPRRPLPPDLAIAKDDDTLVLHLERETRGWEWNHVMGALVKLLFIREKPAPITFLVLPNVEDGEKLDRIRGLAAQLLTYARGVKRLYLAAWCNRDTWGDTHILRIVASSRGRRKSRIVTTAIFPLKRRLPNPALNLTGLRPAG